MFIHKKTKIFLTAILVCFLIIILTNLIGNNIIYEAKYFDADKVDISKIKENLKKVGKIDLNIKLNDNSTYYNTLENIHYYYVDEVNKDSYVYLKTTVLANKRYNYIVDDARGQQENNYYIDFEQPINILVYNDDSYYETSIKFTSVPIMNIKVDSEINNEDKKVVIDLYSKDYNNDKHISHITSGANIRIRGSSSSRYPKKSYRISLTNGNKKNQLSLLNMGQSDEWILDSMYSDFSKVRSKLAFYIWNEINSYTHDKMDNDLELQYVDVYLNHEYIGLYLLKEPIDWQKLNLKETTANDSGILIKGISYVGIDALNYDLSKKTTLVGPFEMKYPNEKKDNSIYWDEIINKVYNYYFDKPSVSDEYLFDTFEIYNFVDYKILLNVIVASDNFSTKNLYLSLTGMNDDEKVIITPWDLDTSFGLDWSGELPTLLKEDYDNYKSTRIFEDNLIDVNRVIKKRYFELRENVLALENIYKIIDLYYEQIKYSAQRDSFKWLEADIEKEISNVKTWYKNRIEFLDKFVGEYNV